MTQAEAASEISLRISRTLNAPRELVFQAWTEPDRLKQWWRAHAGFSTPIAEVDLRVGGRYRLGMQPPDKDAPYVVVGTYREIRPPEKLVYTWAWELNPSDGTSGAGSGPAADLGTGETLVTVEFLNVGGKTEVVVTHEYFPDSHARDEHQGGWGGCLDQLAQLVEGASL